jgi:thiosulfate dehydrogenase (quinone) large subunit
MSQRTRPVNPQKAVRSPTDHSPPRLNWRHRPYLVGPPPKASALSGWSLLPLRAFLGVTFCFAGLQKLANPNFFNAKSPSSIQAQLIASIRISPLHDLLGHLLRYAVPIGVVIALAEIAVGLGALLGLWTRIAAAGGMMLAFTLFLTVSIHSSPYYTGADIVFVFAWIPLIVAGSGGVLSLDSVIKARVADEHGLGPPNLVPIRFALVQQVCGHYENGTCASRRGRPCDIRGCPFLSERHGEGGSGAILRQGPDQIDRRAVVLGGAAAAAAAVVGGVLAGGAAVVGRAAGGAKGPSGGDAVTLSPSGSNSPSAPSKSAPASTTTTSGTTPTTGTTPMGTQIGRADLVPVGGSAQFTDPKSGDPGLILQPTKGSFVAYDAVCPHAGCTVGYSPAANLIVCPCHGSEFDPSTGAVVSPPASHGLTRITVAVDANGELVVDA